MKNKIIIFKTIVLLILFKSLLFSNTYTISGKVIGSDSLSISDAMIIFSLQNSDISDTVYSNENGEYDIIINTDPVSIEEEKIPDSFQLYQNYPNPFNPGTWIKFHIPKTQKVTIDIYNILGQKIKNLCNATFQSGESKLYWDGSNSKGQLVSSGLYIYCLKSGNNFSTKRMVLLDGGSLNSLSHIQNNIQDEIGILNKDISNIEHTLNIQIKKEGFVDITDESSKVNDSDTVYNKNFRLFSKYHICYNRINDNGYWQVFVNTIDGNSEVSISNNQFEDCYYPKWSPNGKHIVFRWDNLIGGSDIYQYNFQEKELINLTKEFSSEESASDPYYTPDGEKIVYKFKKSYHGTFPYIMDINGNNKTNINHTPYCFVNDSYNYFYVKGNTIYKTDLGYTYNKKVLSDIDSLGKVNIWLDDINPDNEMILCHEDSASWTYAYSNMLKTYNIQTGVLDTIVITDTTRKIIDPKFSHDYSKIIYKEETMAADNGKLIIIENDNILKKLVELSGNDERFGRSDIFYSPNNRFLAYSVSYCEGNNWLFYNTKIYLYDTYTNNIILLEDENSANFYWNPTTNF